MGMKDIFRKIAGITDEEDEDIGYDTADSAEADAKATAKTKSTKSYTSHSGAAKPRILPVKLDRFDSDKDMLVKVTNIADEFMKDIIIIINDEQLSKEQARRVIDIFFGVSYATSGEIINFAEHIYIIKPKSVDICEDDFIDFNTDTFSF